MNFNIESNTTCGKSSTIIVDNNNYMIYNILFTYNGIHLKADIRYKEGDTFGFSRVYDDYFQKINLP
jgi:hypothetical protein